MWCSIGFDYDERRESDIFSLMEYKRLMKKSTKAFQLDHIDSEITIAFCKKEKKWYPISHGSSYNKNDIFIYGRGHVKIDRWKKATIQPFSNPYTAEEVKQIADEYGVAAAMGCIKGWGLNSLYHDQSHGLSYAKNEVAVMAHFGKVYDEFTDKVQAIGDAFMKGLFDNGFLIEHKTLWYDSKGVKDIVGFTDRMLFHPLQHVETSLGYSFLGATRPMFNPITFDSVLVRLFMSRYRLPDGCDFSESDEMTKKYESVQDRITHLTSKSVSNGIVSIFDLQEVFD